MSGRSLRAALLAAVLTAVVGGVVTSPPAEARKVGNPGGGFTLKVQSGSLRIRDKGFEFVDEGRSPQCSDGSNNDGTPPDGQDSAVDFPADPQCTSATDDSETVGGHQPKQPILMQSGTITAAGAVTFPMSGVSFPPQYLFVNADDASGGAIDDFVVTIQIFPIANFTGQINPLNGSMDLRMQVRVSATGGPLSSSCGVNPIDINALITGTTSPPAPNTPISGVPYDTATGRTTHRQQPLQRAGRVELRDVRPLRRSQRPNQHPARVAVAVGNNEAKFLVEFTPTKVTAASCRRSRRRLLRAQRPSASRSTRGPAPAPASPTPWDFDNNGSVDATGVTCLAHLQHARAASRPS